MTALRERFMAELRHHAWRRFSRLLPDAAGRALYCALWASLLFEVSVRLGVCSQSYFLLPGTFFVVFLPYFLWKDRPKLVECAREADEPERGGNCALNAFELISRGAPASPFAEYAVVRGLEALAASHGGKLPFHWFSFSAFSLCRTRDPRLQPHVRKAEKESLQLKTSPPSF